MKKFYIALAASLTLGFSSCIEETLPTDYVIDEQLAASESANDSMATDIYTTIDDEGNETVVVKITKGEYTDENGKTHWIDEETNRWAPSLIIKAGAEVKVLNMNGRSRYDTNGNLDVIIEAGANIGEIINEKL